MTTPRATDRATLYDQLVDLMRLGPIPIPAHVPDDVALAWLKAETEVVDLRHIPNDERPERGRHHGVRPEEQVTGVGIHQTGTLLTGPDTRFLSVPCHAAVRWHDGAIVLLHEPTALLWHGHAINRFTLGIEVECRAPGLMGEGGTVWLSKKEKREGLTARDVMVEPTWQQLVSLERLLWYYDQVFERSLVAYAHRQGHSSRIADPGEQIWKYLEKTTVPMNRDARFGTGTLIPGRWRLDGNGPRYSWRFK